MEISLATLDEHGPDLLTLFPSPVTNEDTSSQARSIAPLPLPMQSCRKERSLMFCRGVKAGSQPPSETPAFSATL
ncbi:hypothetical protein EYF80_030225 [Liparis tanakae]|uniref:Uncharacterized protein n=1 Tax=Liparis tanakae TaxID=230148 RepID=A0A4Z2H2P2_9TELE|nr:hypothetical protein EYF80_030225 [Liparis tanakae]